MLFAIAGSQGTGKSTLLAGLKEKGFKVTERKVSRSILADWGKSLEEIYQDLPLAQAFHQEIASRKWNDELPLMDSDEVWFTERTFADSYVYALLSLGRYNAYSTWLDDYYTMSLANNILAYKHIFYLPSGRFKIEQDWVRAHNARYARLVDSVMADATLEMCSKHHDTHNHSTNLTPIHSVNPDARIKEICEVVDRYKNKNGASNA